MFVFGTADDVFGMAVRIEENGYAFYAGIAERADNRQLRRLFEDLAEMENGHIMLFKALRSDLAATLAESVWDPEGLAQSYLQLTADTHVFTIEAATERVKQIKAPDQALDVALQFEKDSVAFFLGMKEILPDPAGKGEIDKLILSEMDHIRMLSLAKKSLAETGAAKIS